jgi:hypothetical protein
VPQHVDTKAVDAALEPEAQHAEHRLHHFGVAPVEVGLLGEEGVVVVLAGLRVERPRAAAEVGKPVVRLIAPEVPVALRVVARGARFAKPRVLVGGVVGHEVEDQLEPARVRRLDQAIEVGERAEHRVDAGVIGDVVAEVLHRRRIDRREPQRVDAELGEVVEARQHAGEIADAVAVGVHERARVDLVHDAALPPERFHAASG